MKINKNQSIYESMSKKSDEELKRILKEKNNDEWVPEVFSIIKEILIERQLSEPPEEEEEIQKIEKPESKLVGVRGFLGFSVIFFTLIRPLVLLVFIASAYQDPGSVKLSIEDFVNLAMVFAGAVCGFRLYKMKEKAHIHIKIYLISTIVLFLFFALLNQTIGLIGAYIKNILMTVGWIMYFQRSKRVENTYNP